MVAVVLAEKDKKQTNKQKKTEQHIGNDGCLSFTWQNRSANGLG